MQLAYFVGNYWCLNADIQAQMFTWLPASSVSNVADYAYDSSRDATYRLRSALRAESIETAGGITAAGGVAVGSLRLRGSGSSDPASPNAGDMFYRTDLNKMRVYNGTAWEDLH